MRKAILAHMIGPDPMHRYARRAMAAYAKRLGATLVVRSQSCYPSPRGVAFNMWKQATIQKLWMGEILKVFDRVLFLDADILVTPEAPDIFEIYDDPRRVYMFDEGWHRHWRDREIRTAIELLPAGGVWRQRQDWQEYFNSGVILYSRGCRLFDLVRLDEVARVYDALNSRSRPESITL